MYSCDSITDAITGLKARGYTEDLNLKPYCIECKSLGINLNPSDFLIDEYYRFEGDSNPDDNSIIYAISSKDGSVKGTLVDAYGMYSESLTDEMVAKLKPAQS
jgi:hypothetical protein